MPLCLLLDRSSVPNLPFAARVPTVFCSVGAGAGPALGHDLSRGIPVPQPAARTALRIPQYPSRVGTYLPSPLNTWSTSCSTLALPCLP
ncbi:hypothetical protein K456DRAFT_294870 [Colletotrichum gloeosporioides 23]|nr:hypothetical protein K456DRAFT_294870 [Colletotrichum gloeosporioides 23]